MELTQKEQLKVKRFCQEIINKPRRLEDQIHQRQGKHLFCEDWGIIEICKYLFNGRSMYLSDPPPNRLKDNPLWTKEATIQAAEAAWKAAAGDVDVVIEALRITRNGAASRVG